MLSILRAGLVQTAAPSDPGDPAAVIEATLRQRLDEIEQAVRVGVQLLCFPELCCMPWFLGGPDRRWLEHAWGLDHPALERVRRTAGLHRCVVVFPFLERGDGALHSTAAIIDADGRIRGLTRRHHVPAEQRGQIAGGPEPLTVHDTDVGRIGVAVGQDLHLPEVARCLGLQGAEIILFPTATTTDRPRALWEAEPLAVASQNACWVAACNRVGRETLRGPEGVRVTEFSGSSYLADARGRFLARASRDQATTIRADLPMSRLREDRKKDPPHSLRRPEIYAALVK
jgi:beta-ureidopropionase